MGVAYLNELEGTDPNVGVAFSNILISSLSEKRGRGLSEWGVVFQKVRGEKNSDNS